MSARRFKFIQASKCLNIFAAAKTCATFLRKYFRKYITSASKLPRSFLSGNPSKMPVKCQYKFLTRLIFLFSGSSCYLLTSERDEDNPFKPSNDFYFVFVNERAPFQVHSSEQPIIQGDLTSLDS